MHRPDLTQVDAELAAKAETAGTRGVPPQLLGSIQGDRHTINGRRQTGQTDRRSIAAAPGRQPGLVLGPVRTAMRIQALHDGNTMTDPV